MANSKYIKGLQHFAQGDIAYKASGGDTIKTRLVRLFSASGLAQVYTFSSAHESMADINAQITTNDGGSSTTTDQTLTTKTTDQPNPGTLDADDVTHPTVTSTGSNAQAGDKFGVVVYKSSGSAATDWLIAYFDTGTGFEFIPNGGDEKIKWSAGTDRILTL